MLLEAADHDLGRATEQYESLSRNLGGDDPVRSAALYWLGRAQHELGQTDQARVSLRECVRIGIDKARCLELLGRIELEASAVTEVPIEWRFDDTTHGFVHPWRYADKGSIRIHREPDRDDPMLAWRTTVDVRKDDQLVVGFHEPQPAPRGLRFLLRSRDLDAWVRLQIFDVHGRRYSPGGPRSVVHVPRGQMVVVELPFALLQGEESDPTPFDPGAIERFVLQDVTAYYGDATGENELQIDDFQVY